MKEGNPITERGSEKLKRNHYMPKHCNFCTSFREIYKNRLSSDLTEENFSYSKLFVLFFPIITNLL